MQKTDTQLKKDVETELGWDPKLNAAQIGVTVAEGAVSMFGTVDTYAQRWAAAAAAKRVSGVRSLAQELQVKLQAAHQRTDSEIAIAIATVLKWDVYVPSTITATVQHGVVTLEGTCTGNYERESAERSISTLTGVVSVENQISLKPELTATGVKDKVEAALQRQAAEDGSAIHIATAGGTVTLTGEVSGWKAVEDARRAAWAAPGVTEVVDQLKISYA